MVSLDKSAGILINLHSTGISGKLFLYFTWHKNSLPLLPKLNKGKYTSGT